MTHVKTLLAPAAIVMTLAVPAFAQDAAIDINGDGMYSYPELTAVLPDLTEADFEAMVKDPIRLDQFWDILDVNGNNLVSLAEIDKLVVYTYPILNNKKALMRAYKQT